MKRKEKENINLAEKIKTFREKTGKNFNSFYEKYYEKLVYYNNRFLKDECLAEDIASEAIMKSLSKIDDYDPNKARYSTWLFVISKNECMQHLNKNRIISIDACVDQDGATIKDFLNSSSEQDEKDKELFEMHSTKTDIIKDKINTLKEPYKQVMTLRELENKSYREITILLKEEYNTNVSNDNFNIPNGIKFVDPDKKENENDIVKFCSIDSITDIYGRDVEYNITKTDKDGLIDSIDLAEGSYNITGEVPLNINNLKSQIRGSRHKIKKLVKDDFEKIDKQYLN